MIQPPGFAVGFKVGVGPDIGYGVLATHPAGDALDVQAMVCAPLTWCITGPHGRCFMWSQAHGLYSLCTSPLMRHVTGSCAMPP